MLFIPNIFAATGCDLNTGDFFGFPHWYEYLQGVKDPNGICTASIQGINDIWRIVAAVIEILLRVSAMVAVAMVIYAGVSYVISQGEPDKTAKAKNMIINSLLGLAISVMAAFIITFIAESIK